MYAGIAGVKAIEMKLHAFFRLNHKIIQSKVVISIASDVGL